MTITITDTALRTGERNCQRGPAGECQNNVGGGENKHYRGRDKKNGATRKEWVESWVVKNKEKVAMICEQSRLLGDRERIDSPTSVTK